NTSYIGFHLDLLYFLCILPVIQLQATPSNLRATVLLTAITLHGNISYDLIPILNQKLDIL
ncbi:MAG: hypothetical protein ACXAEL_05600, partial [Candidatus Hodarchaeales archaeon]